MHGHRKSRDLRGAAAPAQLRRLLLLLAVAQLMVILDITAVNVALPDMAESLGISGGDIGWTITSYSLVFGSLLLLGGRLADLVGRRRVFLTGLGVFTVASVAAAFAGSEGTLFAARSAQGLGAALLSPAALAIIMATFTEGSQRAHALGVWGAVGGAGAAVGVLLGGVLTSAIGWEVVRALKQDPVTEKVKVVMLTAIGEQVNAMTSPIYGADAHIDKPFDFTHLERTVARLLE